MKIRQHPPITPTALPTSLHPTLESISKPHTTRTARVRFPSPSPPVALLHDGYFLDNLLKVGIDWDLFDGEKLTRLLVDCLVHRAIGALAYLVVKSKDIFGFACETFFAETE